MDHQQPYLGLDISDEGVRLVQLEGAAGTKPRLAALASAPFVEEKLPPRDKLAEMIKQLVEASGTTTKDAVVGLSARDAFAAVISLPKQPDNELKAAVAAQAAQLSGIAAAQLKLDWQKVGEDDKTIQVFLAAATAATINDRAELLAKAGLKLLALETNAIAITRSLIDDSELPVMIVNFGRFSSEVTIVRNHVPQVVKAIGVGGNDFIDAISKGFNIDHDQTMEFTRQFGLDPTKLGGQVLKTLDGVLSQCVGELQAAVKEYLEHNPKTKIEKVLATGSITAMPKFNAFLANSLSIPAGYANPWINISYESKWQDRLNSDFLEFPVAVGLAQRAYL